MLVETFLCIVDAKYNAIFSALCYAMYHIGTASSLVLGSYL